jgi:hypothetical protein
MTGPDILFASIVPGCFLVASVAIAAVVRGEDANEDFPFVPDTEPPNPDDLERMFLRNHHSDYVAIGMSGWSHLVVQTWRRGDLRFIDRWVEEARSDYAAWQRQNGGQP